MSTNNLNTDISLHALPDYIKEGLDMIVVGLNPSLTSAQIGHYFAGPGNHFWSCVSEVGLVSEPVTCYDDSRMLDYGIGFTNACDRATKGAADLSKKEMKDGMKLLLAKLQKYTPKIVVFNGKGTYEIFVRHKHFGMGKQPQRLEGTNAVVFVMPSSSARCAQLPRAADKIPFFSALKELRDKIKSWSNGLSTGGRLVPLEETVNTSMFPDQIDLELTRLYDAGKSNYSTDRAEKKRKANAAASNGISQANLKMSSSEDSSQGSAPGVHHHAQQHSKSGNYQRCKEERLPPPVGPNLFMPSPTPAINGSNGQWVTGTYYNSSFSYQQYLLDSSSSQYPPHPTTFSRYPPSFRPNIQLPNGFPPPTATVKNYLSRNHFSSTDDPCSNVSFTEGHTDTDTQPKSDIICQKNDTKENNYNSSQHQQASTNFVSLLMSDSLSVPGSPCEIDKTTDSIRFSQPLAGMSWCHDNGPSTDTGVPPSSPQNNFWEHSNNNNFLLGSYFGSRRPLPQEPPLTSMFSSFQSTNMGHFDEQSHDIRYQSPSFFYSSSSPVSAPPSQTINSVHSPLSSDQVTSSLCSVKVTPDSTSLANLQKRSFSGPDVISISNKMIATDELCNGHLSDYVSLTYTDL